MEFSECIPGALVKKTNKFSTSGREMRGKVLRAPDGNGQVLVEWLMPRGTNTFRGYASLSNLRPLGEDLYADRTRPCQYHGCNKPIFEVFIKEAWLDGDDGWFWPEYCWDHRHLDPVIYGL